MLKRVIIIVAAVLLICGGLWFVLYMSGVNSFSELMDNLLNYNSLTPAVSPVTVNVYEITNEDDVEFKNILVGELETALRQYFITYNQILGELSDNTAGFAALYEHNSPDRAIDVLMLERVLQSRKTAINPLTFPTCDIGLKLISAVYADSSLVEIRVQECFAAVFDGYEDNLSSYAGVEHFFLFDKSSGKWLIKRHESNSAFSLYINAELNKLIVSEGFTRTQLDTASIAVYVYRLQAILDRGIYYYPAEQKKSAMFPYDREKALEHAFLYTERENVKRSREFTVYEYNSTNFTSQCLYAGELPMDSIWSRDKNAWINAAAFYDYISSDTAKIIAGICGINNGEIGDIIQFADGGGQAVYSALITAVYNNEYLITANSEDYINFPLLATGFDIIRTIKIYGYN
ncbi:MAG: amidase domain-containing protein [Oscillospiraceae bacterium]|nr:amidase domain-containing protein [Oscillospiraceae bacterium]